MSIETEIRTLQESHGVLLKAEHVVGWAAENTTSALHRSLEWDNEKAGHEYRLEQARRLIRLHIINQDTGVRQLVSLQMDRVQPGGGYRTLEEIKSSPPLREMYLNEAFAEFKRMRHRYDAISRELEPVWEAVAEVERAVAPLATEEVTAA